MTTIPVRGDGVAWRAAQFLRALVHRHNPDVDRRLRACLDNEAQWRLLERLSPFDRAHHLRVHDSLVAAGYSDPDLLLAAALHDVGKADGRGRVRLIHRVLKVVLEAASPSLLARASQYEGHWMLHGLFLARHHARLGAELAAHAGVSKRCADLMAGHENVLPVDDRELEALILSDRGAIA